MALFGHFPYTNFHEMNMDWLLRKVRELADEWFAYNTDWTKWKNDISGAFTDLQNYVENYFKNLDVKFELEQIVNELINEGYFEELINKLIDAKENINANLVGSKFYSYTDTNSFVNGSCYLGNNKCAIYYVGQTNIGTLRIYDTRNMQMLYETDIELNHGNSLTYDPESKILYAVRLYNVGAIAEILPNVARVDMSDVFNPVLLDDVILPLPTGSNGVYSMSYDPIYKEFYAMIKSNPTGGSKLGEVDRVVIYDRSLGEIKDIVFLKNFINSVGQGIQSAYNGLVYMNHCDYGFTGNVVYDIKNDGARARVYTLPTLINGYRGIGEFESQFYDYDNNSWYGVSTYIGGGYGGMAGTSIFEMGITKALPDVFPAYTAFNYSENQHVFISVNNSLEVATSINTMPTLLDAINISKTCGIYGIITVTGNVGSITIINFKGTINGTSANPAIFSALKIYSSWVRFSWANFGGNVTNIYLSDTPACIAIYDSIVNFQAIFVGGFTQELPIALSRSIMLTASSNWKVKALDCIITINAMPSSDNYSVTYTALIPFTTQ